MQKALIVVSFYFQSYFLIMFQMKESLYLFDHKLLFFITLLLIIRLQ
jgi:hypothetical protein